MLLLFTGLKQQQRIVQKNINSVVLRVYVCCIRYIENTGLFEMIVGVLTTCHTQYCTLQIAVYVFFFYLIEQHSKFLFHTLHIPELEVRH